MWLVITILGPQFCTDNTQHTVTYDAHYTSLASFTYQCLSTMEIDFLKLLQNICCNS